MSENPSIVILGAGLTGLSAAAHLEAPARVIERADRVGGLSVTVEEQGYRFDRTGHLLHLRDEETRRWALSLLDEEPLRIERQSRIWSHGVYTRYPFQANTFGLPPEVARDCLMGFLEARDAERDGRWSEPPADFEAFILRHMGTGIARHFMIPYNTKLWGVTPREMSPAWTDRFVPRPTLEEVVAGAVGCNDHELGYNAFFYYPRRGIGELAEALGRRVGDRVELGRTPRRIELRRRRLVLDDGEVIPYRRLISTIPLDSLLALIDELPEEVSAASARLRCAPLWYLDVALGRPAGQDLHWVYVPEPEVPFYRVGAYSNFSPALVPEGGGSLYVELASRERPDLEALLPRVTETLTEMGLISGPDQVAFVRPRLIHHAYVIYDHAYNDALDRIHPFLEQQGIHACGRYGRWEYSAMEDALIQGRDAAQLVQEER